jgi:hypothetical protein
MIEARARLADPVEDAQQIERGMPAPGANFISVPSLAHKKIWIACFLRICARKISEMLVDLPLCGKEVRYEDYGRSVRSRNGPGAE